MIDRRGILLLLVTGCVAPADTDETDDGVAIHEIDDAEAQATLDYWTDERIAAATPLEEAAPQLDASDKIDAPLVGEQIVVEPTEATEASVAASSFVGTPSVGTLFHSDGHADHYCTASVVTSPHQQLIITAAHCVRSRSGWVTHVAFVPQFHDGKRPFGTWALRAFAVDSRWISHRDQDLDFAFAGVRLLNGRTIQSRVGSHGLIINQGWNHPVTVIGYPDRKPRPIRCTATAQKVPGLRYQSKFVCGGYTNGTSGSPWLLTRSGRQYVNAVLGGFEEGGVIDSVSYSSYFDADVHNLYQRSLLL